MTINTRRASQQRLAGLLGLVLALQPAAGLAAIGTESAATASTSEEIQLAQRRGGGGGSRGGSRSGGRTGFSNYSGSRSSNRQSTRSNRQGQARTNSWVRAKANT